MEKLEGLDWKAILTLPRSWSVSSPVEIEECVDDWNKYKKSGNKSENTMLKLRKTREIGWALEELLTKITNFNISRSQKICTFSPIN